MSKPLIKYLQKNLDEYAILACLTDLAFTPGFELNDENQVVLSALRRSSEEFKYASVDEISDRLNTYDDSQIGGLVSNVKGIAHEMEFVRIENDDGDSIYASIYPDTNHPGYDVQMFDELSGEQWDVQLKATDDKSYVNQWIEQHPDGEILITEELAQELGVKSSGIENEQITAQVEDFVDKLIDYEGTASLVDYFPMLSVMSVSVVVYELWKRYDRKEISYDRFKFLAAMAAGKKTLKIGILILLLGIPGVNFFVGTALIANLIYSTNELVSEKLDTVKVSSA